MTDYLTPRQHRRLGAYLILALTTSAAPATTAAGENPALDGAFQKLASLQPGQGLEMCDPIRQAVVEARTDKTIRTDLEARLIAVLESDATDLAKDHTCRQLVTVGSDRSVPVLAILLPNARMSHMARYGLEGIGSPVAIAALREMLDKTSGPQKMGLVISLGRLADVDAVPALAALLDAEDVEMSEVAAVALGRIGSVPAADALARFHAAIDRESPTGEQNGQASHSKTPQSPVEAARARLIDTVIDAELHAAESLCQRGEYRAAIGLYEPLLSDGSQRVRAAALRGLIAAKPDESLAMIVAGLAAEQSWKRTVAADCVAELNKPQDIKAIAAAVPDLPVAGKIAALVRLKHRCDPAVREAALRSLDQADTQLRVTALAALVASARAEDISRLADLITSAGEPRVRDAAFKALCLTTAAGTNQAIVGLMNRSTTSNPVLVKCALARRSPEFVPAILKAARSSDAATRMEAFKALAIMATEKEAEALAELLCETSPGAEREVAGRAVWMSCQRIPDPALRPTPLLAALEKADAAGQCAILPTLARLGGKRALAAVHAAMQSRSEAVRDAGYRALANWPNANVADELLDIAKTSDVESYRIWALRAYARAVSLPSKRPPEETFEMLSRALELAKRTKDQELIVARMGSVRLPDALALLLSFVDDDKLGHAAIPAVFAVAKGLSQSHPDQAKAALKRIQPLTEDAAIRQQIRRVLRDIDKHGQN